MEYSIKIKRIVATLFSLILFVGFIKSGSFSELSVLSCYLANHDSNGSSIDAIESDFSNNTSYKAKLVDLNGTLSNMLHMKGLYSDIGIYVSENNYIISSYFGTSTDYEYKQITSFYEFLQQNGVNLLYVNQPVKYIDDSITLKEFGLKSFSNENADVFLERIGNVGIPYLDLRKNIKDEKINTYELFYRTDHHWTTKAGFWATSHIAESMNDQLGYNIDLGLYDISRYNVKEWKNCWLGEQGKKISQKYIGLDDYTEIKPTFATSYTFPTSDAKKDNGTFDSFINEGVYNLENDVYVNPSWHYSYSAKNCVNNNVEQGKVLLLGDSYAMVTEPFLSLGVNQIDFLILRSMDDSFSLRDYILENQYDTVLICYAQFMIGAHDNPQSANYKMFSFDK